MKRLMELLCVALAALCALYGFVVMGARSGTRFYVVWFAGALFFLCWGWVLHFGWPDCVPAWVPKICRTICCVGVLLILVIEAKVLSHFQDAPKVPVDTIIVLGAQIREATGPTVILRWRLDCAYDYLEGHPSCRCIVSGGQGANEPCPEAEVMRDYLVERGISPERIFVENASRNTIQNILFSKELLQDPTAPIGIVTNDFHLYRALSIARKQGLTRAEGLSAHSLLLFLPNNMLRECAGVLKDKLMGNM